MDGNEPKQDKIYDMLNQFQNENTILKQEVDALLSQNFQLEKEMEECNRKQKEYEDELEELRGEKIDRQIPIDEHKQKQHLKNMVDNLKEKLLYTVRENEMKISGMKEQISILEGKLVRYEYMEEQYEDAKRKYHEYQEANDKVRLWEK